MPVDLEDIAVAVAVRTTSWAGLGVLWKVRPIDPNHGKAVVVCEFESTTWLGGFTVWETGEAELASVRTVDDWIVNKHYNLTSRHDLEVAIDELQALLALGSVPPAALTFHNIRPL